MSLSITLRVNGEVWYQSPVEFAPSAGTTCQTACLHPETEERRAQRYAINAVTYDANSGEFVCDCDMTEVAES